MNERIRKLMEQSMVEVRSHGAFGESERYKKLDPEKFALLIVNECANHCDLLSDHKISSEWVRGTHDCSKAIREQFGVRE